MTTTLSRNDLVCHITGCGKNSMVASVRIARFVAEQLNLELFHEEEMIADVLDRYPAIRNFIFINSPTGFASAEMRDTVAELVHRAERSIFVQNDYKMKPPSQIKNYNERKYNEPHGGSSTFYNMDLWTAVPAVLSGLGKQAVRQYIDWGKLSYRPIESVQEDHFLDFIYWGAFRKGREKAFSQYLNVDGFHISSSRQSAKHWHPLTPNALLLVPFRNLVTELTRYKATVYLQDEFSNKTYCSPGNRLYEALSAGVAVFVARESISTLEQAGFELCDDFIVSSSEDIKNKIVTWKRIAAWQRAHWARDFRTELAIRLDEIYESVSH